MNIEEIKKHLLDGGYKQDRWGHFQKGIFVRIKGQEQTQLRLYRVKLQAISVRVEVQIETSNGNEWIRVSGCYLKDVYLFADGRLRLGSHIVHKEVAR